MDYIQGILRKTGKNGTEHNLIARHDNSDFYPAAHKHEVFLHWF